MLFLLRCLAGCPLWFLHALGTALGWAAWWLSPTWRRRSIENAARAGVSRADLHESVRQAGRLVAELPWVWLRPAARSLDGVATWADPAVIERRVEDERGLLLLTPHMGCFEIAAQSYAQRWGVRRPLTVLYRPARKAWVRELEETARARAHLATAPATLAGVRQMIRALRKGEMVGLLPDQVPPAGMGVWAPFFGRAAYTMTLAARLARQTGAAVVVLWAERLPRGRGYRVHARELPDLPEGLDDAGDAAEINRWMEDTIRECPGQYLWSYHRYKQPRSAT
jgi:KDO2-lipid IV(A) lauroyltransferase